MSKDVHAAWRDGVIHTGLWSSGGYSVCFQFLFKTFVKSFAVGWLIHDTSECTGLALTYTVSAGAVVCDMMDTCCGRCPTSILMMHCPWCMPNRKGLQSKQIACLRCQAHDVGKIAVSSTYPEKNHSNRSHKNATLNVTPNTFSCLRAFSSPFLVCNDLIKVPAVEGTDTATSVSHTNRFSWLHVMQ